MSTKVIETNNISKSQHTGQECIVMRCEFVIYVIMWILSTLQRKERALAERIVMECFIISNLQVGGFRKHMISQLLREGMFWVSQQLLVDQANIFSGVDRSLR